MSPPELSRVVSSAVVPVVIISACGLLCLAFYNRMAAIVSRLRAFQRERLREQERSAGADSPQSRLMLQHLHVQTAHVARRAKLIRLTLMFLLLAIAMLILCSLTLALSALAPWVIYLSVALFVLGLLSMLCSIIAAMLELKAALHPVELESQFVSEILHEAAHREGDAA